MKRTRIFAAKIGDGGLLDSIIKIFGSEQFQSFITQILSAWITGCALPTSGRDAKRMAEEEFEGGKYNRRFLRRATRTTRKQARKDGHDLTPDEMEAITIAALDAVRLGDEEEMTLGICELHRV